MRSSDWPTRDRASPSRDGDLRRKSTQTSDIDHELAKDVSAVHEFRRDLLLREKNDSADERCDEWATIEESGRERDEAETRDSRGRKKTTRLRQYPAKDVPRSQTASDHLEF